MRLKQRGSNATEKAFREKITRFPRAGDNPIPDDVGYPQKCGALCRSNTPYSYLTMWDKICQTFAEWSTLGDKKQPKNIAGARIFVALESDGARPGFPHTYLEITFLADAIAADEQRKANQTFVAFHVVARSSSTQLEGVDVRVRRGAPFRPPDDEHTSQGLWHDLPCGPMQIWSADSLSAYFVERCTRVHIRRLKT